MWNVRTLFWLECGLAVLSAALAVSTLIWNNWIELLFEVEPDGGDGWFVGHSSGIRRRRGLFRETLARMEFQRLPAQSRQR